MQTWLHTFTHACNSHNQGDDKAGSFYALKQMSKAYIKASGLVRHVHREKQVRLRAVWVCLCAVLCVFVVCLLWCGRQRGIRPRSPAHITYTPGYAGGRLPLAGQPGGDPQGDFIRTQHTHIPQCTMHNPAGYARG